MSVKTFSLTFILLLVTSLIHPGPWSDQPGHDLSSGETDFTDALGRIYESLHEPDLNCNAFYVGMLGFRSLCAKGLVIKDSLITIIDYSLPSSEDRFFVINLRQNKVICKTLVAHGRNSGELYASRFSNKMQSHQSAIGFYITGQPYQGGQGYSMMLTGVDTGYNDQARIRSIVVHGAQYVTHKYVEQYGRLGRSFGCPALPPQVNAKIINLIMEGSVLFSYYPDDVYLSSSHILSSYSSYQAGKPVL
jgi:hypothetical protein